MKKLLLQLLAIFLIIAYFASLNASIYCIFTRRLGNNFSDASQAKMIDVGMYLPHEENSDLVRITSSLKLTDNLPVLDGATALLPIYAAIIDAVYPVGSVTYEGGSFSDEGFYGENFAEDSKMQYKNTVRGYKAIVDGETDILFCAAPSKEQAEYAQSCGVELVYIPIGLEAFVFFVNESNPINNLTSEEIRSIYAGEITNWKEVGGANRIIDPISRINGSGSQTAMERFMGNKKIAQKSLYSLLGGSIGFSFRYYMDGITRNNSVKMLSLDGVYPSAENIKNGSYPVISEFYAIYRADNSNENIPVLIDWILSEEGQSIIEGSGYVGIK